MKKLLSILLTGILFCSLSIGVLAANDSRLVATNGYFFAIQETMDESHVVTRSYHGGETLTRSAPDLERTKALLISLGWTQEMVEQLPVETLQELAQSTDIVATAAYSKRDEATGAIVNLPEATARAEAAAIEEAREERFLQQALGEAPSITPFASDTYQDSYMYLIHTVSIQPGNYYLFMTDAQWLTMPTFRAKDTIGACADSITAIMGSESGYFTYKETSIDTAGNIISNETQDGTFERISFAENSTLWVGFAGILNLPKDTFPTTGGYTAYFKDLYAHIQFRAKVKNPTLKTTFNSIGTYEHSISNYPVTISITPGMYGATIGISNTFGKESRSAYLDITYIP